MGSPSAGPGVGRRAPSRASRLGLLASLYLAQGVPFGFFTQAVPVVLRESGASLPAVGASGLLALPWALKFLWAPAVDRWSVPGVGRRRSWLLPLQVATALVLGGLAAAGGTSAVWWLACGMLATSFLAATQDIATDGLAVDLLPPEERGYGNGIQVAGYRLGMILGGSALLWVFGTFGWAPAFLAMAAVLAATTLPVLLWREPPTAPPPRAGVLGMLRDAARPGLLPWLLALAAYKAGDATAAAMVKPLLVDAGLGLTDIGWLNGAGGSTAGMVGALLGGWGAARLGTVRAVVIFGAGQAVGAALWIVPALYGATPALLWTAVLGEALLGGMATAALFTAMMECSRPSRGATDYTVQACAVVVATGLAGSLAGLLAERVGYPAHFGLAALACVVGVLPIALVPVPGRALVPVPDGGPDAHADV